MTWLAGKPDTVFIGQSVVYPGTAMFRSLEGVPAERKIEMPVAEEMQCGIATGLGLEGFVVVSLYPRFDFLLLACNQLVNHLDKLEEMSEGKMVARVIIRTMVGPRRPLDAGPQHTQNHTKAFRLMLKHVNVVELEDAAQIVPAYQWAYERPDKRPTLLIEVGEKMV